MSVTGGSDSGSEPSWASREVAAMVAAWERGEPVDAAEVIRAHPDIDDESAIRLIYEEVSLRREAGQEVTTAEVVARHPRWADDLEALFDCDRLLRTSGVTVEFPEIGETIGAFHLIEELGRGASGRTFLATDPNLAHRPVVLKVIPDDQEEHLALATLRHTHIVPLFSEHSIPERGLRLLCMPYLGGTSLSRVLSDLAESPPASLSGALLVEVIQRNTRHPGGVRLPSDGPFRRRLETSGYVDSVVWIVACLTDAVQYAHERGLVHMDIKPSNVLITEDGQPILLDFHLSRPPVEPDDLVLDRLGGTPGYMSPEAEAAMTAVAAGKPILKGIDGRTDIYSLGVLLDEMLFRPAAKSAATDRSISTGLRDVIAKCRAPEREDRYRDAAALAEDLRRHLNNLPLKGVRNRSLGERWAKWRSRRPGAPAWAAVVVILGVAVAAGAISLRERLAGVDAKIAQARTLREARRYEEAEATLAGLRFAPIAWADGGRRGRRDAELRHVRLARVADNLHALADRCRANYGVELPTGPDAEALERSCAAMWERRSALAEAIGDAPADRKLADQIRSDLVELVAIWHDVRTKRNTKNTSRTRSEAAEILRTADAEFGPSHVLAERLAALEGRSATDPRSADDSSSFDHYDRGRTLLRAGAFEEAAGEFERALHTNPQHFWANFYKGQCDYQLGRYEAAVAEFRVCASLAPELALCRYNRAKAYEKLGRAALARLDYSKALELDPRLARAWLNRGILSYREGRRDDARSDFASGLEAAKSSADADPATLESLRRHLNLAGRTEPTPR